MVLHFNQNIIRKNYTWFVEKENSSVETQTILFIYNEMYAVVRIVT